jgi:hypothetical protein
VGSNGAAETGERDRLVTGTPSLRLYALGAIMCGTMVVYARLTGAVGAPPHLITLAVAVVTYLLAIPEFIRTPKYPRRVILICLVMAAAWRIPFLLVPPGPQDDVLRYVWDGRLQRLGYNPYTCVPGDPALAKLHTDETREMNNQDVPTPYPAGAQLFFRAVTAIHESAFAFKIALTTCDLAIVLLLLIEFGRLGREHWVLAYAWHPLLVICVAYNAHVDTLGILLLLVSAAALQRHWRTVAAIVFALAVTVKLLPVVLAPLYWRRVRIRDGLLAALTAGLLYTPFLRRSPVPIGSLGSFVQRFRFNGPIFAALERVMSPQAAAGVAVLCGLATAVLLRSKRPACSPDAWAWPMAASLLCAPVVYPWYLLWLVPFLRSASTLPLTIWTLSILSVFFVWYSHTLGHLWQVPGWVQLLEFGPVATAAALALLQRRFTRDP